MLVDWFWFSLVLSILLLWLLWHWPQLWPHFQTTTVAAAHQRLLKPRTPDDCPTCRQTRAAAADYPSTHIPVIPWRERKSRRGAPKRILTQGFACPKRTCAYYRITDAQIHALVGDGAHGRGERIQTLRCQACGTTFSTRCNTPLYGLKTASHRVAEVLTALAEGLSIAAATRVFGHRHATITRWLTHLQLDELRTRLRSQTHVLWLWLALDPLTKIIPVLHLGVRTQAAAHAGKRA
jgi:transposase-like protein